MKQRLPTSSKVKVLHVIAHMEKGGAERQLCMLVEASRHSHVIAVLPENERLSSAAVEYLPGLSPLAIFQRVREIIQKHDVDIVQLWLPDRITIPAMFAARFEGCRLISGDRRRVRNYGTSAIRDRLIYLNHIFADLVIPNYPYILPRWSLRRFLRIPSHTCSIFNGVDFTSAARPIQTVPTRLLFVGRLVEQKRVDELLQALPLLFAQAHISGLDIVGEGTEETRLRRIAERFGVSDKVVFHGYIPDWSKKFDPNLHFLVLPSVSEGMSNTVFEAIAQGFLPIVRKSKELQEIMSEWDVTPVMVDMDQPNEFLNTITSLTDGAVESVAAHALKMQANLSRFSVSKMVDSYDKAYEKLSTNIGGRS